MTNMLQHKNNGRVKPFLGLVYSIGGLLPLQYCPELTHLLLPCHIANFHNKTANAHCSVPMLTCPSIAVGPSS